MIACWHDFFTVPKETATMSKKKKSGPDSEPGGDGQVTFTVRLRPTLIKRAKVAAALLELPVQMLVSMALDDWLRAQEGKVQAVAAALKKENK
jgi:hypothetical protein